MKQIVLASESPRRRELLQKVFKDFRTVAPQVAENLEDYSFSYEKIEAIASLKALSVANTMKSDCIIISADTVVVLDDTILTKPKDYADAFKMLSSLSGRVHHVVTSICVIDSSTKKNITRSVMTDVVFRDLSPMEIQSYIELKRPFDKAGAYGIQETDFAKSIVGSYENVVGLCTKTLKEILQELEVDLV